ncbi:MAG: pilus assembly protein [Rhizobiaceae bacterium]|nr:pilus assembly protein [Rhizobiaceae bacterium]
MSIQTLISKLKNQTTGFLTNQNGAIAIIFGIALLPVMISAGIAVDYSRIAYTEGAIANALDAAVLMSGQALSEGKPVNASFRKEFDNFFYANINGRTKMTTTVKIESFSADPATGKVAATVKSELKTAFMGIIGINNVDITSNSEAVFSSKKVELTMMLDVTGSMDSQGKLSALKSAATNAIDILMPTGSTNNKVRIALVPYSASVNIGSLAGTVSNNPGNDCVTERYNNEFNDVSYTTTKVEGKSGSCPNQEVVPLSSTPGPLKTTINSFTASGYTAGHLGVAWSYYTLSPNWGNAWPSSPTPAGYSNSNVQKIALLMTDGEFNTIYTSGWNSSEFAESTCTDMKANGILIYSIAFKAPGSAKTTLSNCASPDTAQTTYFYSAESSSALSTAFTEIANDIKGLRLSK